MRPIRYFGTPILPILVILLSMLVKPELLTASEYPQWVRVPHVGNSYLCTILTGGSAVIHDTMPA